MAHFATVADRDAIEGEMAYQARDEPVTMFQFLDRARRLYGTRDAISFQLLSDPGSRAETLTWTALLAEVTKAANLFRSLGVGPTDTVAYLLPNANETVVTLLAGAVAGIVNPINPLLEPEKIASILRETKAKVLVTLKPFPKSDVAQKAARALEHAPGVTHLVEIDLNRYLAPPKSWIVPFIRPKNPVGHKARILDWRASVAAQPADRLTFDDPATDRIAAYFHTGGTTGMPKVAQHRYSGMVYNGWLGNTLLFDQTDVLLCPLPMFHVLAAYPVLMSCIHSGAHMVMPTPAGYRGEGVFDNFWKLIERWHVTFLVSVPTAIAALMQRPVNADVSTLKTALTGSAPLPIELYNRFKAATGVEIAEGYGLTEATCLVSFNPLDGPKKVGSVGIPLPYTKVRILRIGEGAAIEDECGTDEVGEICLWNPGVVEGATYTEADKNRDLFVDGRFLRTGDLGRIDPDGYLWITGRAKDLIIRGGHNIDPALIEEALIAHPAVAVVGAIGQPDAFAGELPAAYVELAAGKEATPEELLAFARERIEERAAVPKYIEILPELPKTAVGKVFKPDLRRMAIRRVLDGALAEGGFGTVAVAEVVEDKKRGLVAKLRRSGPVDEAKLTALLGGFTTPWDWDGGGRG